jgi:hypothetical protein
VFNLWVYLINTHGSHFCYICGDKIIQSAGPGVTEALQAHYRKCTMFDHGTETDSDDD